VRALLRLQEQQERVLEEKKIALRKALEEGDAGGDALSGVFEWQEAQLQRFES
jgi:hypothetical protein